MTDPEHHTESSGEKESSDSGAIIDAAARRRPRLHGAEADHRKEEATLDFLADIPLKMNVVLGGTTMSLGEIIALESDSIVQLDKPSGDPLDVYVGNQRLGTGEVIVLHEKVRIRILEVTPPVRSSTLPPADKTEEG